MSKLELLVLLAVVGILASIVLERMLTYQELVEKTVMEATVTNMRSGMRLRIAELKMRERNHEIGTLLQQNPIDWLEQPPANYRGTLPATFKSNAHDSGWFFDAGTGELVYRPRLHRFFESASKGDDAVRFRVVAKNARKKNGEQSFTQVEGLEIVTTGKYMWF